MYKFFYGCMFLSLLVLYLRVELLDHTVTLHSTFWKTARLFSKVPVLYFSKHFMRVQFTIVLMLLITEYVLSYKHCINLEGSIPDIFKERKSILLGKKSRLVRRRFWWMRSVNEIRNDWILLKRIWEGALWNAQRHAWITEGKDSYMKTIYGVFKLSREFEFGLVTLCQKIPSEINTLKFCSIFFNSHEQVEKYYWLLKLSRNGIYKFIFSERL